MDPYSPEYMRMNNRVTTTAAKLFPSAQTASYRKYWEKVCLRKWLDDPAETPDVQARRRSPNYLKTYEKYPPKFLN